MTGHHWNNGDGPSRARMFLAQQGIMLGRHAFILPDPMTRANSTQTHMWTAPSPQGVWQCFDQIVCVHMSGGNPLEPGYPPALHGIGRQGPTKESRYHRLHAASAWHPERDHEDEKAMENRRNGSVELMKTKAAAAWAGSRPTPPTAVAQRASLEAAHATEDYDKAKQCLTNKTVAQASVL